MTADDGAAKPARRWTRWAVYAVGIALFALVLWNVSWHDSVVRPDGTAVIGTLLDEQVPRGTSPDDEVTLALEDGTRQTFRLADLAQDEIGGERFARINEGIFRIVRKSDAGLLLLGALLFGLIAQVGVWRWFLLLRAQGVRVTFWTAHKLTFIGFFFNSVVPGPTGGDVIKAVYVARHSERRAPAVMTVLVDRVLGLVALAMIALFALLPNLDNPSYRELSVFILGFLACMVVGGVVFFSRRIRRVLRVEQILAKLPMGGALRKADEAMFAWRGHKGALVVGLLLSFLNQICCQGMMVILAMGLGVATRTHGAVTLTDFMIVLPVAFIASSLPVLPGGWGLRETAFAVCFHFIGVDRNPAVALSVTGGMVQLLWSLLGGVYFVVGRQAGEFRAPDVASEEGVPVAVAEPDPAG